MCIILTCEKFVRPDHDLLETCFYNNPDGAGFMWCEDGRVQTAKGFSVLEELEEALGYVPDESRLVIHMRIATSGGIDVGTCHPFPICDDLDMLHCEGVECDAAIAHNGVIAGMPTDEKLGISDTVSFVSTVVTPMYKSDGVTKSMLRHVKEAAPGNRFALMTKDGEVHRLGAGWETVTKGIQASNSTWRYDKLFYWPTTTTSSARWSESSWNDGWYYDEEDDYYALAKKRGEKLYDDAYESVFDFCCGDCMSRGSCMAYGPVCDGVADLIDAYQDDETLVLA